MDRPSKGTSAVGAVALAAAAIAWDHSAVPLGWIGLGGGVLAIAAGLRGWSSGRGRLAWVVGWCLVAAGVLEFGAWMRSPPEIERDEADLYVEDELFGLRHRPGAVERHRQRVSGRTMFDVLYTIDEHGRRVVRPADEPRASQPKASVHLFGGSFVFGFGLEDADSLPWQLQERLGAAYRVYGWAQMGWGAHQALARFESGEVEAERPELPATVVYWAIGDHTRRLLGQRSWDGKGPRYVLDGNGRATYAGSFVASSEPNPVASAGESFASRSCLRKWMRAQRGVRSAVSHGDVELWAAVVEELRDEAQRALPDCRFAVLLETGNSDGAAMLPALEQRGIEVLAVGSFLGEDSVSAPRWKLDPHDGHPSALATAEIASGLAAWIEGDSP